MKMKIGLVTEFNDYLDYYLNNQINKEPIYLDEDIANNRKTYNKK